MNRRLRTAMRLAITFLLSTWVASSAYAELKQGEAAPQFTAQASLNGKALVFDLKEQLSQGPVVVYFYPSAFTGGCSLQAHTFAVNHQEFLDVGASVVGISMDNIDTLNEFSADPEYCAGKFPVIADPTGRIAKDYEVATKDVQPGKTDLRGVPITHARAERVTFIVATDGTIAATVQGVSPPEHVYESLKLVQTLHANRRAAAHP